VDAQVGFPNTSRHTYAITDDKKEKSLLLPQGGEFFVSIFDNKHYLRNSPTTFTILIDDPTGKAYQDPEISKRKRRITPLHSFTVPSHDSSSSDDDNKPSPKKRLSHGEKLSEIKSIGENLSEDQPRFMLYLPTVLQDQDSDSKKHTDTRGRRFTASPRNLVSGERKSRSRSPQPYHLSESDHDLVSNKKYLGGLLSKNKSLKGPRKTNK